jgi:hypothetical protein
MEIGMRAPKLALATGIFSTLMLHAGNIAACGGPDPCISHWAVNADQTPVVLLACPAGDTGTFLEQGFYVSIEALFCGDPNDGLENIPAADSWLYDPGGGVSLCGGFLSSNADSVTNLQGLTTMSNTTLAAGGCSDGLALAVQGYVFTEEGSNCSVIKIEPIHVRSPDLDGSLTVDLTDLAIFAQAFPPASYEACTDLNGDGVINVTDLAIFALHFGSDHGCN